MSDLSLLKGLQQELIDTLEKRKKIDRWVNRDCCKEKIKRLRLLIQEVMMRIENECEGSIKYKKEEWE